jgi:hypothetical protein
MSRRLPTAQVRTQVRWRGICGGQGNTGAIFSEYFGFPCQSLNWLLQTHHQSSSGVGTTYRMDSVSLYPKLRKTHLTSRDTQSAKWVLHEGHKPVKWFSFLICCPLYCHITGCAPSQANGSKQPKVSHTINFQSSFLRLSLLCVHSRVNYRDLHSTAIHFFNSLISNQNYSDSIS